MLLSAARSRAWLASIPFLFALGFAPSAIEASSGGMTGVTQKPGSSGTGCNSCHSSQDAGLSVVISGSNALNAGQASTYTITSTKSGVANGTKMGIDVAASDSPTPLSAVGGQCTNVASNEITHNQNLCALHTTTSGSTFYQFNFTMPAAAAVGSTHTLYASSALGFLGWNHATSFVIYTRPTAASTLSSSNVTSASVNLSWANGGPAYRIVYQTGATAPASPTSGTQVDVASGTSTTINGLSPSTQYSFAVYSKLTGQSIFSSNASNTVTVTTTASVAATRYVNASTGVNTGNCTSAGSPCKTITYAMGQSVAGNPGDLINVAPGTYNVALGEVFPITFKTGTQLVATGNPTNTIIDGAGDTVKQGLFTSSGNNSPTAKIDGFTIQNGTNLDATGACPSSLGGALRIASSSVAFNITRNVFSNNQALGYSSNGSSGASGCIAWGGAIYTFSSTVNIVNNVFIGNIARGGDGFSHPGTNLTGNEYGGPGEGGALYLSGGGTVINNTFENNTARGGNGGQALNGTGNGGGGTGGAVSAQFTAPTFRNNIFANNSAASGSGGTPDPSTGAALLAPSAPANTNNLFYNNTVNGGVSNADTKGTAFLDQVDPAFHSNTNMRLHTNSPALGAGTATGAPATDQDGTTRPNPPAIGAFEGSLVATTTSVISSANPAANGQAITFTATVDTAAGDVVTGTATFKDGATVICNAVVLDGNGQAQCTTSSLATGTHSITVVYGGDAIFAASTSSVLTQDVQAGASARLINISTRGQVQTGFDVMIGGFVISGSVNKTLVIRAIGPSLVNYGVAGALANPQLQLVRSSDQAVIASNDDWGSASNAATVQASGFAPSNPLESAIYIQLQPGAYTAIVSGVGGGTGVGLVEVYEVDAPSTQLINISTRGKVLTGFDVMIGGFVVSGSAPKTLVVRAIGPSLANYGVAGSLQNPQLQLVRSSDQVVIATNDDWGSDPNAATLQSSGFAPSNPLESAIYISLQPGAYTAIVSGVSNGTGVGLVEVYTVGP